VGRTSQDQMYDAFGAYVRSQRQLAQLTLRQAAELASISNPYLSQIEHGLARPSIAVISALASALSVSAETMLLRAAGLACPITAERSPDTEAAIRQDPRLDDDQRHALLAVLASFVGTSSGAVPVESVQSAAPQTSPGKQKDTPGKPGSADTPKATPGTRVRRKARSLGQQPLQPTAIDTKGHDHA
jgi:transcriptional regulator with XRE-family HTH domain